MLTIEEETKFDDFFLNKQNLKEYIRRCMTHTDLRSLISVVVAAAAVVFVVVVIVSVVFLKRKQVLGKNIKYEKSAMFLKKS